MWSTQKGLYRQNDPRHVRCGRSHSRNRCATRHAPDPGRAGIGRARCQLLRDLRRVFYRGKAVAVLGEGEYALEEARTLLPVAASVTLLTSGAPAPNDLPEGLLVDERPVSAVEGEDKVARVTFKSGDPLATRSRVHRLWHCGQQRFCPQVGRTTGRE